MPTPFLDVRFPDRVALGATGGPGFKTGVVTLVSGVEERNREWAKARGRWDISTGMKRREYIVDVIAHFYAVGGMHRSFRFKDHVDYQATNQAMEATGSPTVWQLVKRYPRGGETYVRTISKPVNGTVVVKVGGATVTPASIDHLTGRVTFATAPGSTPTASFSFDVPVRFDTDQLPVTAAELDIHVVSSIELIEVRGE